MGCEEIVYKHEQEVWSLHALDIVRIHPQCAAILADVRSAERCSDFGIWLM